MAPRGGELAIPEGSNAARERQRLALSHAPNACNRLGPFLLGGLLAVVFALQAVNMAQYNTRIHA